MIKITNIVAILIIPLIVIYSYMRGNLTVSPHELPFPSWAGAR